jgi:hypothetical protein
VTRRSAPLSRRAALSLPLLALACSPRAPAEAPARPGPAPHLEPLSDLATFASMRWLIHLRMREIASRAELMPAIARVIPEDRFAGFAAGHGGVDVRQLHELVIGRYAGATLWLARGVFDAARVERAFRDRAEIVEGRAVDRTPEQLAGGIVRTWGRVREDRAQLAMFGREAIALELAPSSGEGAPPSASPLRVAELFAEGRLKKAAPALRTEPLRRAAELLGDAPARGFAPGPFEGDWAAGFGGLLAASTAAAIAVRPASRDGRPLLACTLALLGAWEQDDGAATRLAAWLDTFGHEPLGRLLGVDKPVEAPRTRTLDDALVLEASFDAEIVARGLHDAVGANVREIMSY